MEEVEKLIESMLFMSGKPVSIYDILKITDADLRTVKSAIKNLQTEYEARGSWIEIANSGKMYMMRMKPDRVDNISDFVQETELSKRALRVLSVVAQHDGVLQSKVVKTLGTTVYEGVQELAEKGYLLTEMKGNSKVLKLSHKFKEYFGEIPTGSMPARKPEAKSEKNAPEVGQTTLQVPEQEQAENQPQEIESDNHGAQEQVVQDKTN